jgi:hypothetical protein
MEPALNSQAYLLLAEERSAEYSQYLERESEHHNRVEKNLRHRVGSLLITIGEKIQGNGLGLEAVFEDGRYSTAGDKV